MPNDVISWQSDTLPLNTPNTERPTGSRMADGATICTSSVPLQKVLKHLSLMLGQPVTTISFRYSKMATPVDPDAPPQPTT